MEQVIEQQPTKEMFTGSDFIEKKLAEYKDVPASPPLPETVKEEKKEVLADVNKTEPVKEEKKEVLPPPVTDASVVQNKKEVKIEYPDYLKDEEANIIKTNNNDSSIYDAKIKEYEERIREYEERFNDPIINSVLELRKLGIEDLSEIATRIGKTDVNKMTIEELYRVEAEKYGLSGEDLEDEVRNKVDNYESLSSKIDKKKEEARLRSEVKVVSGERLKSFTETARQKQIEQENISKSSLNQLETKVKELVGKQWKGLLINEEVSKEIAELAPIYSSPIVDEKGNLTGYDIDRGIKLAIYDKFGKQLLKANYDAGRTMGYEEAMKERMRPSENYTGTPSPVSAGSDAEEASKWNRQRLKKDYGF
jgi:hypothetical protein